MPDDHAVTTETLLRVDNLDKVYAGGSRRAAPVHAVTNFSIDVASGQTVALVGESGCGKTTVGQCVVRLTDPTSGRVWYRGTELTTLSSREFRAVRREMQFIFQDPFASLNPALDIAHALTEPVRAQRMGRHRDALPRARDLAEQVGLHPNHLTRYPRDFSGGQRQRIVIARALMLAPRLLVLDEPVSALDVSIQAQILNLLAHLQGELGLGYLFISHDLSVVRYISDVIAVMYLGHLVEVGPRDDVLTHPAHPYTQALLAAVPASEPHRRKPGRSSVLTGDPPSPFDRPSGCPFRPRCVRATTECAAAMPPLRTSDSGAGTHRVACFHPGPDRPPSGPP